MAELKQLKKIYIASGGCNKILAEGILLKSFFIENDYIISKTHKKADIIIFNPCACCKTHEDIAIKEIQKFQQEKSKHSEIIVWGCLPKINQNRLDRFFKGISFGIEPTRFNDLFYHKVPIEKVKKQFSKKGPYVVDIADGCLGECTFCAVKNARGTLRSRKVEDILGEVKNALKNNYNEFCLFALDLGCYGKDIGTNLIYLLEEIDKIKNDFKVSLGPINPVYLKLFLPQFIFIFSKRRFIKSMQIDAESGSNRILKLMNRRYTLEDISYCFAKLTKEIPSIELKSNFIVGFPGETEEDFNKSIELIKKFNIFPICFKYEKRPFTLASDMPKQVSPYVISRRYNKMNSIGIKITIVRDILTRKMKNFRKRLRIKKSEEEKFSQKIVF